jgi:aspartyl-tRNA(Asn)/glutamyl-tRNA(Gln) amidotransferase subunit B
MVDRREINAPTGKALLDRVEQTGQRPADLVASEGLGQVADSEALRGLAQAVLAESPDQVAAYRSGKATLIGWFVGQVMRKSGGKADPNLARQALEALLQESAG